jgi:AcrR family transcriptional regulator
MSEKMDRRKVRTKQLLYQSLMSLIEEKGVEHVTVTDIAQRAEVNRGTFYLHYQDVPAMLQQLKDEVFEDIKCYIAQLDFQQAVLYGDRNEAYPLGVQIFEAVARHADFLRIMFSPKGDLSYAIQFRKLLNAIVTEKFSYRMPEDPPIPYDYLIAYITSANFGLLMHWIESGLNQTPLQMAAMLTKIMNFGPLVSFGIREYPGIPERGPAQS